VDGPLPQRPSLGGRNDDRPRPGLRTWRPEGPGRLRVGRPTPHRVALTITLAGCLL
jgi:hypothetical protein